jgi:hypothetical protein
VFKKTMSKTMRLRHFSISRLLFSFLLMTCIFQGQAPKSPRSRKHVAKTSAAPTTKFLTLAVGEQFSLPECDKRAVPPPMYAPGLPQWCWQDASGTPRSVTPEPAPANDTVLIHIPPADAPPYIVNNILSGKTEKGKLQAVSFHSNGVRAVDDILEALTSMYGKPTQQEPVTVENNVGVEFTSQNALWQFTNLSVEYRGVDGDLSIGTIWIETPAEHKRRIDAEKKTPAKNN